MLVPADDTAVTPAEVIVLIPAAVSVTGEPISCFGFKAATAAAARLPAADIPPRPDATVMPG